MTHIIDGKKRGEETMGVGFLKIYFESYSFLGNFLGISMTKDSQDMKLCLDYATLWMR